MAPDVRRRVVAIASPLVVVAAVVGAWEALVRVQGIPPLLLPTPTAIVLRSWDSRATLTGYVLHTGKEALVGLLAALLVAIVVGVLVHESRPLAALAATVAGAGRALPAVVLYPVVTVFLGTTSTAVVTIIAISMTPLLLAYVLAGLTQRSDLDDLLHVVGGERRHRFTLVRVPLALPFVVTGLRTALPIAVITAIVGEYFGGSTSTLGANIRLQASQLRTVDLWAAVTFACLLGVLAFVVGALLERATLRRLGQEAAPAT